MRLWISYREKQKNALHRQRSKEIISKPFFLCSNLDWMTLVMMWLMLGIFNKNFILIIWSSFFEVTFHKVLIPTWINLFFVWRVGYLEGLEFEAACAHKLELVSDVPVPKFLLCIQLNPHHTPASLWHTKITTQDLTAGLTVFHNNL